MSKRRILLDEAVFRDKVLGCWLGKNAGGTLGEPFEERFGREEMFEVSFYTRLQEGGLPNDDLELQLIWLQTLQEKGPGITAEDLAESWLDCIVYNFDEYGLSKANLQRGLRPPVSGWHNNWFKDCMGSPIRSEIWACVAPAAPQVAARYAFHDAICDHAGGESVFGEVFNAVVESWAFVESDPYALIDVGLSAIPRSSRTSQAISRVVQLHREGVDWKDARERLRKEFFHPVAQYSPLNLAFQTIGWLYGEDFGDTLCKAVACGWDTDCTAATAGSILGIISGARGLPRKWLEPLGERISTNLSTGGIRHLRAPTDIRELTDQVCDMAPRVLGYWNAGIEIGKATRSKGASQPALPPLDATWLEQYAPNAIEHDLGSLRASIRYDRTAAVVADAPTPLTVRLSNPHPVAIAGSAALTLPAGFSCTPAGPAAVSIAAGAEVVLRYEVTAASVAAIGDAQTAYLVLKLEERPVPPAVPIVLLGGTRWLASPVRAGADLDEAIRDTPDADAPPSGCREIWRASNDLEPEQLFAGSPGVVHLVHHVHSDIERRVVIGVPNTSRMAIHLEGQLLHRTAEVVPIRPNLGNGNARGDSSNYVQSVLRRGWNRFVVTLERGDRPLEAHFVIGGLHESCVKCHGMPVIGLVRSRFSWEGR